MERQREKERESILIAVIKSMATNVQYKWYRIAVTWYRRETTAVIAARPAPIPLCLSQIPNEMSLYRIWATNLCVMTQPIKLRNKSA